MKFPRRQFLQLTAGAAVLPTVSKVAQAQAYPTRPLRLIIGYTPGGSADLTARLMEQWLSERLGQSFVIENRPGGGTNIATEAVVRAQPDGYTLLLAAPANAINATLYDKLNFNFLRDMEPVAGLIRFPNVVVVHPSLPVKSIPELIAYAKANFPANSTWRPPATVRPSICQANCSRCSRAPTWSTCLTAAERRRSPT
jgi:tripartite-type tricarboxylate transporter receptor subunit TctC